ncbi:MAG: branched-chain amino acid ABC transporter permease [Rhodocyclaceae bacterium]|jgi:branched-chain amino acid transport system permease protein|nr:branched-chain amino acid ABC transporter permease [Rhodocyclaceae bacterium]MBK7814277.1 branched-chain amino acid ABC transporter permease [Rhodocyclaceae bacterium]MBK9312066.1 branched-chain amino acid ABC transporter permease [Rhodocyclaceae bacterium]
MDIVSLLIQTLNAVQYGLVLFLVASGLTLIFGIMRIINLAHGSFYMIGAYMAFGLSSGITETLPAMIAVGLILSFFIGFILEWVFYAFLYQREHLEQVLLTYGLILVFEELRSILFGNDVLGVAVPEALAGSIPLTATLSYPVYRIFISAACLIMAGLLYYLIRHTRLGMMIRAGSHDRNMVQALGINIDLLFRIVFALGFMLAAFSGMISAPMTSVSPGMGNQVLIISFVVVVIGGIGSVGGAMVAAMVIAFADVFGKLLVPAYAGMFVYLVMALVLLWRPEGIFRKG